MYSNNKYAIKLTNKRRDSLEQHCGVRQVAADVQPSLDLAVALENPPKRPSAGHRDQMSHVCRRPGSCVFLHREPTAQPEYSVQLRKTWALTDDLKKTKILTFKRRSGSQKDLHFHYLVKHAELC